MKEAPKLMKQGAGSRLEDGIRTPSCSPSTHVLAGPLVTRVFRQQRPDVGAG